MYININRQNKKGHEKLAKEGEMAHAMSQTVAQAFYPTASGY